MLMAASLWTVAAAADAPEALRGCVHFELEFSGTWHLSWKMQIKIGVQ